MNKCPIYATLNGVGSVRLQSPDSENSLFSPLHNEEVIDMELVIVNQSDLNCLESRLDNAKVDRARWMLTVKILCDEQIKKDEMLIEICEYLKCNDLNSDQLRDKISNCLKDFLNQLE